MVPNTLKNLITYKTSKRLSARVVRSFFIRVEWNDWFKVKDVEWYLKKALRVISAWDKGKLVGIGTLIGDGRILVQLDDLVVDKKYQRKRIGTTILERLVKKVEKMKPYWFITDVCEPHTEKLYAKFGFRRNKGQILLLHDPTYQEWGGKAIREREKRR